MRGKSGAAMPTLPASFNRPYYLSLTCPRILQGLKTHPYLEIVSIITASTGLPF
jgi:hypothetical protein